MTLVVKNPPANAGDSNRLVFNPGLGRSPRGGDGKPLQYSCLENPMDRGAWQSTVHGVAKSWTPLSKFHFNYIYVYIYKIGHRAKLNNICGFSTGNLT